jgi:hypothetical protein
MVPRSVTELWNDLLQKHPRKQFGARGVKARGRGGSGVARKESYYQSFGHTRGGRFLVM